MSRNSNRHLATRLVGGIGLVGLALWPLTAGRFEIHLASIVVVFALGVIGVDLLSRGGMLQAGYGVFFGTGAYTVAVVGREATLPSGVGVLAGCLLAGVVAVALGPVVRRVSGYVFALVTLAASASLESLVRGASFLGGTSGIGGITSDLFGWGELSAQGLYVTLLIIAATGMYFYSRMRKTRIGRALESMRETPHVAEASGVNLTKLRSRVWVVSGCVGGLVGGLFAVAVQYVSSELIGIPTSIQFLVMNVVGGQGIAWAGIPGALLVRGLPQAIQQLGQYQLLFIGVATVAVVIWFPKGIAGTIKGFVMRRLDESPPTVGDNEPHQQPSEAPPARPARASEGLRLQGLSVRFGGINALDDVTLSVRTGEITALVGPNGSGKTTLINVVGGRITPEAGEVVVAGRDVTGTTASERAAAGVARTFQLVSLCEEMTAIENVMLGGYAFGRVGVLRSCVPGASRAEELEIGERALVTMEWLGIKGLAPVAASDLAGGQRRLVEIARCLMTGAPVLLLDEPASGLNASERESLADTIVALKESGRGVLLVEHDMDFVMGVADRIAVLLDGKLLEEGSAGAIAKSERVSAIYFGDDVL